MKVSANPRLIGLFVMGGLLLTVVLLLMFGSGQYFGKVRQYVAYFDGSVNGLNNGAPVKLRGVTIGRVREVLVQYDLEHSRVLTPVIAEVDLEKVMQTFGDQSGRHEHPSLQDLIDRGLRARLSLQSLVTNQLYVDIDFLPDRPGHLVNEKTLRLPEIPTLASNKDEIERTLQQVAKEVRDLPLKETVEATLGAIRRVDYLLSKPETNASIDNLNRTLQNLQQLLKHLDGKVDSVTGNLDRTASDIHQLVGHLDGVARDSRVLVNQLNDHIPPLLGSATDSFRQARGTLSSVEALTQPDSELSTALRDLSDAARAIRRLAENLERHPDNLLYGRKKQE
ncbi:MAG: MlaD family protein [Methylococcus sp.]